MMYWPARFAILLLLAALPLPASAAPPVKPDLLSALRAALPGRLINDPASLDWTVYGPRIGIKPVTGTAAPGGGAIQITVTSKGQTVYASGAMMPLIAPILKGQRVVVSFYARTIKSDAPDGRGIATVRFQENGGAFAGFGDTPISIGSEWKLYEVTTVADKNLSASLASVAFQLAGAKQIIQFGQTIVVEGAASIVKGGAPVNVNATPVMLPQLAGKGTPVNDPASIDWRIYGAGVSSTVVAARGLPGDTARRVVVPAATPNAYEAGVIVPIAEGVAEGDSLLVGILARTINADTPTGLGRIDLRVQQDGGTYPGFAEHTLAIGPTWKLIQLQTRSPMTIRKGQAVVALRIGGARQTLEINRVYVLRMPRL